LEQRFWFRNFCAVHDVLPSYRIAYLYSKLFTQNVTKQPFSTSTFLTMKNFLLMFLILFPASLFAQREQIGVRYEQFGAANIDIRFPSNEPSTLTARSAVVNASFRNTLDKDGTTLLTTGFQYRYTDLKFSVNPMQRHTLAVFSPVNPTLTTIHALTLDMVLMRVLSEKWILFAAFRPGIFTSGEVVDNSWRIEGGAFADYRFENGLSLGVGAARSSNFGRVLIVPVLHVLYVGESFLVDVLLPQRAEFWYYPSQKIELGLNVALNGSQYALGNDVLRGAFGTDQFGFANGTVSPIVRYAILDKTFLSAEVGYTFLRRAEFVNSAFSGESRFVQQYNPANTWFFRAGVQLMY
jgi:hypothetical protein